MALTDTEKDMAVARFDNPLPRSADGLPGEPLSQSDKSMIRQARVVGAARRKVGRPRVGKGAKIVPISIERTLLDKADRFARQN